MEPPVSAPSRAGRPIELQVPATPRAYRCQCGRQVYFRNSQCLRCGTPLGYVASSGTLLPLQRGPEKGTWQVHGTRDARATVYRRCANFTSPAGCNWLISTSGPRARAKLCEACALNRTIPDLSRAENQLLWKRMEKAKRRLVSQLIGLGLPVASKVDEDPEHGLACNFLRSVPGRPRVMTGHGNGIITINLEEADDPVRERTRQEMDEPYRTLLGHFRHEVGHYYWDRLVAATHWLAPCRALFGDERLSYGQALKAHYEEGPPPDWRRRFVSSYASTHPWEDWAETWAHYLHIRDTLDTAVSFGIQACAEDLEEQPFDRDDLWNPEDPGGEEFLGLLHSWIDITGVMNEMSAAMGQQDFYPFVLPCAAVIKLHFIHCVVTQARQERPALAAVEPTANAAVAAHRRRVPGQPPGEGLHGAH
jgi:hypothetical protein